VRHAGRRHGPAQGRQRLHRTPRQQTVNDAARSYKAWYDSYYTATSSIVSDPQYSHAKVPAQDLPPPAKYSIAPESITEQTQASAMR